MPLRFDHASVALACLLCASGARADTLRRVQVSGDLGYSFPGGSLERGSDTSDVTYGLAELGVDGAYRLHPLLSAGIALRYGAAIPTLCGSSGDCFASLGHDVSISALGRWHIGKWKAFEPDVDLQLGYEWLASKLVDTGATSERSYRGLQASVRAHGQFALWERVSIGPVLALSGGIFSRASLDAPGVSESRDTDGSLVHFWTFIGFRTSTTW